LFREAFPPGYQYGLTLKLSLLCLPIFFFRESPLDAPTVPRTDFPPYVNVLIKDPVYFLPGRAGSATPSTSFSPSFQKFFVVKNPSLRSSTLVKSLSRDFLSSSRARIPTDVGVFSLTEICLFPSFGFSGVPNYEFRSFFFWVWGGGGASLFLKLCRSLCQSPFLRLDSLPEAGFSFSVPF